MRFGMWLLLAGCGSGGATADSGTATGTNGNGVDVRTCDEAFSACGGDPTGLWNVEAVCDPGLDTAAMGCPDATYEVTADRSSGTIELAASGSYDRVYHIDVDYRLTVPSSCIAPLTCSALPAMSGGFVDSCTEAGTDCDCTGTFAVDDLGSGTWQVEGNEIVTDDGDRTQFCIEGDAGDSLHEDGSRVIWSR